VGSAQRRLTGDAAIWFGLFVRPRQAEIDKWRPVIAGAKIEISG
jgi:hypothetical protein